MGCGLHALVRQHQKELHRAPLMGEMVAELNGVRHRLWRSELYRLRATGSFTRFSRIRCYVAWFSQHLVDLGGVQFFGLDHLARKFFERH